MNTQTQRRRRTASMPRVVLVTLLSLAMLVPMYILIVNAFKSQQEIALSPLSIDFGTASTEYLVAALSASQFPVIPGYLFTLFLVVACNVVTIGVSIPAAYVIARTPRPLFAGLLMLFVAGMFIPAQIILVPAIFVLRSVG